MRASMFLRHSYQSVTKKSMFERTRFTRSLSTSFVDTLIIGGGAVGCSTAYHISEGRRLMGDSDPSIILIEKDPSYAHASCMLSAGGIRTQFSLPENIQMSQYGVEFLRNFAKDVIRDDIMNDEYPLNFQEHGYLFLATNESEKKKMTENVSTQQQLGCAHNYIYDDIDFIQRKFPWLECKDVIAVSFSEKGEGWFDPWNFVRGLKRRSQLNGVRFLHGQPVNARRNPKSGEVERIDIKLSDSNEIVSYCPKHVVNAAGAFASPVLELLGGGKDKLRYSLPVYPRKRCIFFFHCSAKEGVPHIAPLTIDPSGVYFRSEGSGGNSNFLCGVSPPEEIDEDCHDIDQLKIVDHYLFNDIIWPTLFQRVPAFGEIKVMSSWAGLYEYNTFDQNALIGFHPEIPNVLLLNGFSGHGLQHSPATGRAAFELIDHGGFSKMDLSKFSFERIVCESPVYEQGIY